MPSPPSPFASKATTYFAQLNNKALLCAIVLLLLPMLAIVLNLMTSFFLLLTMIAGCILSLGLVKNLAIIAARDYGIWRKHVLRSDQLRDVARSGLSKSLVSFQYPRIRYGCKIEKIRAEMPDKVAFILWRHVFKRKRHLRNLTLRWMQADHSMTKEHAFLALRIGVLIQEKINLYRTIKHHSEETEFWRSASAETTICRSSYQASSRAHPSWDCPLWRLEESVDTKASTEAKSELEDEHSILPSATMHPSTSLFTSDLMSPVAKNGAKSDGELRENITDSTSSSDIAEAQLIKIKELEDKNTKLDLELHCKESQLEVSKREAANLKRSLNKRRAEMAKEGASASGELGGKSNRDIDMCWDAPTREVRELELQIKGLKARLVIQEQTLQDTNAGVEHAANVLRMQCTGHIQKSATLHRTLALALQRSAEECDRRLEQALAHNKAAHENLQAKDAEIESLRAQLAAALRRAQASQTARAASKAAAAAAVDGTARAGAGGEEAAREDSGAAADGENAADLAATCSRRVREAWAHNEGLMEALEAERRRCLGLQLQLHHAQAPPPVSMQLQLQGSLPGARDAGSAASTWL